MKNKNVTRAAIGVAAAAALALGLSSRDARPSDGAGGGQEPAADIGNLYAFVDDGKLVMIMTAAPFAQSNAAFSSALQYVFHTSSGPTFGEATSNVDVICTFGAPNAVSCWAGALDYVSGDARDASKPLVSASGKVKVFAGLRADPFFFNLSGFRDTVAIVSGAAAKLTFDVAGCPAVDAATSKALVSTLSETASSADPQRKSPDDFVDANVLALVVSVDKSLVTKGGSAVSVWASTNQAK